MYHADHNLQFGKLAVVRQLGGMSGTRSTNATRLITFFGVFLTASSAASPTATATAVPMHVKNALASDGATPLSAFAFNGSTAVVAVYDNVRFAG